MSDDLPSLGLPVAPGALFALMFFAAVALTSRLPLSWSSQLRAWVGVAASLLTVSAVGLGLLDAGHLSRALLLLCCGIALSGLVLAVHVLSKLNDPSGSTQRVQTNPERVLGAVIVGEVADGSQQYGSSKRPPRNLPVRDPALQRWAVTAAVLAVALCGAWLRSSPAPYLHGGQDQGIYVNVGHHIARTGTLRPVDVLMADYVHGVDGAAVRAGHNIELPPDDSPLRRVREGRWIAGIHVEDAERGRLVPAFFHLFPLWLAIVEFEFGFPRSVWALTLWSVLAVLAAASLASSLTRHLGGASWVCRAAALLAVLGLAFDPLDVWISRFPVSENLAKATVLLGLYLWSESLRIDARRDVQVKGRDREARAHVLLSLLAGSVLALGAFARGGHLFLMLALLVALVVGPQMEGRAQRFGLALAVAVTTCLAGMQAVRQSWPYFFSAASNHFPIPPLTPPMGRALLVALLCLIGYVLICLGGERLDDWIQSRRGRIPHQLRSTWLMFATAVVIGLAAYDVVSHAFGREPVWGFPQQNVSVLVRYSGIAAWIVGIAGLGLVTLLIPAKARTLPFFIALALAFVLHRPGVRYEMYYARYLVSELVPLLTVLGAVALAYLASRLEEGMATARGTEPDGTVPVAAGCEYSPASPAAALTWPSLRRTWPALALAGLWFLPPLGRALPLLASTTYRATDLADNPAQLAAIFSQVPDNAVLIFDARAPGRWRGVLAVPALLSFARHPLVYPNDEVIERAVKAETPVVVLSGGHETEDLQHYPHARRGPFVARVRARGHYSAPRLGTLSGATPTHVVELGGDWELLEIDPSIWRPDRSFSLFSASRYLEAAAVAGVDARGSQPHGVARELARDGLLVGPSALLTTWVPIPRGPHWVLEIAMYRGGPCEGRARILSSSVQREKVDRMDVRVPSEVMSTAHASPLTRGRWEHESKRLVFELHSEHAEQDLSGEVMAEISCESPGARFGFFRLTRGKTP